MYWESVANKVHVLTAQRSQVHKTQQRDGNAVQADDQDTHRGERIGEHKRQG